jgi:hypothetical protein
MGRDTLKVMGASNHCDEERAKNDYYGTNPESTKALLKVESFDDYIWEPAAGHHLIANVLEEAGYEVLTTDLVDYGFGDDTGDFLAIEGENFHEGDIITNPPYGLATEFALKALEVVTPGHKVAMFLRTLFLEGTKRYEKLFRDQPPRTVYVFTNRQVSDKNDDFNKGSAVSYSWFVWVKGYQGPTEIKWINSKE